MRPLIASDKPSSAWRSFASRGLLMLLLISPGCDEERAPFVGVDGGSQFDAALPDGWPPLDASEELDSRMPIDSGAALPDSGQRPIRDGGAVGCLEPRILSLGFDPSVATEPRLAVGLDQDAMQVVFSDSSSGTRRLTRVRVGADGQSAGGVPIEGLPEGAVSPSMSAVSDGWVLGYSTSGQEIASARLDSNFALVGAPAEIAAEGAQPRVAALPDGAWMVWNQRGSVWGRTADLSGAPNAASIELLRGLSDATPTALSSFGDDASLLVASGSASGSLGRAAGRRLGSAAPLSERFDIGASDFASGTIALARRTASAPPGAEPLQGASVFEVLVAQTHVIRFVLLDLENGLPIRASNEATISERDEDAWGAAVAPFETGYVVAYRSRPLAGGPSRIRLAFLSRDSCRLGVVDARFTAAGTESIEGSPTSILVSDSLIYIAWAERLSDATEYRAVATRCR